VDFMDTLWQKVKIATGACAGNVQLSDLHDYLEKGEQVARGASFIEKDATRAQKLTRGADALGGVRKGISTAQSVCMDAQAIVRIHEAIKVLNQPGVVTPGSKVAAEAFGQLFVGAGRFAAKLPPPANVYAQILENCGSFFVNMQALMDPESPYTPKGRQLREIMRSME
jgi:hypothetical protein